MDRMELVHIARVDMQQSFEYFLDEVERYDQNDLSETDIRDIFRAAMGALGDPDDSEYSPDLSKCVTLEDGMRTLARYECSI